MARRLVALPLAALLLLGPGRAFASPFAYVTNDGDSTTSVIDLATSTNVATIDAGAAGCGRARGLAISPSGLRLYEGCLSTNNVAVIDTVTNSVVTTMSLPQNPFAAADGAAVSPVAPRLYVANFQQLAVFDTNSNTLVTSVPLTFTIGYDNLEGVAVTPDGSRVYGTQIFSNAVSVVDTATNTELTTIPLAGSRGIVVDPTGTFVYTGGASGGGTDVNVIATASNTIVDTIPLDFACNSITSIAINPAGTMLYVGCRTYVAVVDVATKAVTPVTVDFNVFGVDVSRDGSKVVAVSDAMNSATIIDTATNTAGSPIAVGPYPYSYPGTFIGPSFTCGNGIHEPGEVCDGTPCCTASCTANTGATCSDGDLCTTGDACNAQAQCAGTPVDCDDGDNCSADACNPLTGACVHTASPKAFGGDDAGCVPPDKATDKCEGGVRNAAAKLTGAIFKCQTKASKAGVKGVPFDATTCKTTAVGKYDGKVGKLKACPACVDFADVKASVLAQAETLASAAIYCDNTSGTPLDAGFVPPDKNVGKCEDGAYTALAKLIGGTAKCHIKMSLSKVKGVPYDEEACESKSLTKFDATRMKLKSCPTCLATILPGLGASTTAGVDAQNGRTYCASPSGAFVGDQ